MRYHLKRQYAIDSSIVPAQRALTDLYYGKTLLKKLAEAVRTGEKILIYGDYDADGIMATYILYSALDRLSPGKISWFINDRFDDGYNITIDSMKKCLEKNPDIRVLITCDNGINAVEAVDYAMAQGVTVLVTDHHVQTRPLRGDCPAVDERSMKQIGRDKEAGVEAEAFCGAELARRVAEALFDHLGEAEENRDFLESLCTYAALATITDNVPMNPSNHALARKGLHMIRRGDGIWGLLKEGFFEDDLKKGRDREIHWDTIGFYYGPLINASGRLTGKADSVMNMLLSHGRGDETVCREAIKELIALNEKRKELCEHDDAIAYQIIEESGLARAPFILVWDERFSEGINGLTAAHITDKYKVPAAVLSPTKNDPQVFKGSARSVEGCDLIALLTTHGEQIRAGGHAMAAGLSIDKKDLETVRTLLMKEMNGFAAPPDPEPDFVHPVSALTMQIADWYRNLIEELEPFGPGFEEPRVEFHGETYAVWGKKKKDTEEFVHAGFPLPMSKDRYFVNANWWNHLAEAKAWFDRAPTLRTETDRYGQTRTWKALRCRGKLEKNEYTDKYGVPKTTLQITIEKILN